MNLTHKIALNASCKQSAYFRRACGVARFVYNWALTEWNRQYEAGQKPTANELKKQFNALYPVLFPWVREVGRDCHSQPFADLKRAFSNFFEGRSSRPAFKKKNKDRPAFYVSNDLFRVESKRVRLPLIGWVRMQEPLRFTGKINSARVVEECGQWFLCVSVEVPNASRQRTDDGTVGVDLGIKTLATLSTGQQVENPKALRKAQKRLRRASRKLSRRVKGSRNRRKQAAVIARIHRRVRNIRHDVLHKLTTRICRENQTVVIEDLNVVGMVKNHRLAQAVSDASFGMFRTLLTYKGILYGTRIVVADRFFPSSKTCSSCGKVKAELRLSERVYSCECGLKIDRDLNAARNLEKLAGASGEVTPAESLRSDDEAGTTSRAKSLAR